ncbi:NAD-dependent succinate-semialdehyde dehydrogenase [soil metagenome]
MPLTTVNPATGEILHTYETLSNGELDERIGRAAAAFERHRRTSFEERAEKLTRAAAILESEARSFGELMTREMGKPIAAAVAEAVKCARACRFYAENGAELLADEAIETDAERSWIRHLPLGPVLAVMPWNFPFWQVFRFAAPALMAGNVGLLKHASSVPGCALAIEDILTRAGFAEGVFQALLIEVEQVERIIDDPRVRAVTLTGSTGAGSSVAQQAGKRIKKTVLELGGSDPFIVMPSADLDEAVATAVRARTLNNGQSCIAAKRFIVHADVAAEFETEFVARMKALTVGNPMDPATDVGPLATPEILEGVERQVQETVAMGARVLVGGERLADRPGNFYPPTVLTDVCEGSPAYGDEIFGPVAALFRVGDLDEALRLANDTPFGLGSSIWTHDPVERDEAIERLDAGMTFVNAMVASDPRLPFGGVKHSGYGRELSGLGIREFVNAKTVYVGDGSEGGSDTETE